MLNWVFTMLASKRADTFARRDVLHAASADDFFRARIAEMPAVAAPKGTNDDVMAPVYREVEQELKRAGHLR